MQIVSLVFEFGTSNVMLLCTFGICRAIKFFVSDCSEDIAGGGWHLVRHAPPGDRWHGASDNLAGTDEYGDPAGGPTGAEEWSVKFDETPHNQFLFMTGDCLKWLIATKEAVLGESYSDALRDIVMSSKSENPYKAKWYNRDNCCPEDPWISISNHKPAKNEGEILYVEDHFEETAKNILPYSDGANVYIRLFEQTTTSTSTSTTTSTTTTTTTTTTTPTTTTTIITTTTTTTTTTTNTTTNTTANPITTHNFWSGFTTTTTGKYNLS